MYILHVRAFFWPMAAGWDLCVTVLVTVFALTLSMFANVIRFNSLNYKLTLFLT